MKSTLLLLFLPLSIFAQEYLPFPLENAKWTNGYYDLNTQDPNFFFYELSSTEVLETSSDTLINSITYTKITSNSAVRSYAASIRESEGRVYVVPPDSINEGILYDFTLNIGESALVYNEMFGELYQFEITVENTSNAEIDGITRKIIEFSGGSWIEGIGADRGLLGEVTINISNYWTYLECFELDGDQIFSTIGADQGCILSASNPSTDSELSVYPNPSTGRLQIKGSEQIFGYQLIDQQGRLIRESKLNTSTNSVELDLTEEKKGIYLIRTETNLGISAHRIVIQ